MSGRKEELEKKKAKLQAIREEKERRRREKEQKDMEDAATRAQYGEKEKDQRKELEDMLTSLGIAPPSDVLSSLSSMPSLSAEHSDNATPDTSLTLNSASPITPASKKKSTQLSVVTVQSTTIAPKETVTYAKQTQTVTASGHERDGSSSSSSPLKGYFEDWWRPRKAHAFDYYVLTYDDLQAEEEESSLPHMDGGRGGGAFHGKLPPGILPHGLPQVKDVQPAQTPLEQQKEEKKKEVRELSEDEKQMIILSEDFQRFVDRAGRIVERALGESTDIYIDYTGVDDGDEAGDDKSNLRLSLNRFFHDERWSRNRPVTSMDWSPQFPELLVASYQNNPDSPNDPDGVCLVWNTKFKKTTPEYIFHCQSPVMAASFARFHPNLILGGTYSGQIVVWDNRVQKRTPIQRTPLSAAAHTHPVYCLNVVGTPNAHNLLSISTDGRLCSWSLDMLSQPQETMELHHPRQSKTVAVTCMAFPNNEVNNFIVGSEEGAVFSACRHGTKVGAIEQYDGHQGPITGISTHAAQGGVDFSNLFLTSSFDWTVKLWTTKETKPLYSFEDNGDYVYDVAWSPSHPALFASVDGCGRLDLWNLNQDTEVPMVTAVVEGSPALNRVSWTPSGLHVTVGDDQGKIWVYDVGEQLAHPRHDEWNRFVYTLQELKSNQTDEEMEKLSGSAVSGPNSLSSLASIASR
ncbi:cytoplasmic dynein 1 intermediate chain-like isoform X3 [Thrips palmi]|uniref:Cytoplasmic dynein 1 intermediate chain-like isoform X3 n=1 Tax=Thrips palmi TaxID=161013 RepID=A0A6P8ZAD2_THRPL|nr:cytoplasmic dynein 1 intermediate chain-like isoform X3 [Thrips palmi]